jgi:exosortase/archaeosortase family protein
MEREESAATPLEIQENDPRLTPLALNWTTGTGFGVMVVAACWAAADTALDRWFAPWGSVVSFAVFIAAVVLWIAALDEASNRTARLHVSAPWLLATSVLLVLYAALYPRVPQLVSCELAAGVLACAMLAVLPRDIRSRCWGIAVLVLLSMHVSTSVEFFMGYPLRVTSTWLAAAMLGPVAQSYGTGLTDGVNLYYVDAPCSGIHMLTYSLVMAAGTASLLRLSARRTIALLIAAVALAVFGNAHRAASLFAMDVPDGEFHTIFGLIVFVECLLLLLLLAFYFKRRQNREPHASTQAFREPVAGRRLLAVFAAAAAAAALSPLFVSQTSISASNAHAKIDWPKFWNGSALIPQPMPDEVAKYLQDFPGDWAQFEWEATGKSVLLRICEVPTRKLHSAENCYLAMGGKCHAEASRKDDNGHVWSRFKYTSPADSVVYVQQCYFSISNPPRGDALEVWLDGAQSWPDISAWYWAASLPGSEVEMTLAIVVASPDWYWY